MIPIHDLENKEVQNVRVVKLGTKSSYDVTLPHRHNYFELFIFDKGAGNHAIDFVTFPIGEREVHIVSSGRVHKVNREVDTNGYVILFEGAIFDGNTVLMNFLFDHTCYEVDEVSPIYQFSEEKGKEIIGLAESIWKDYNSDNLLKSDFILSHLSLILINCIRTIQVKPPVKDKNQEIYIRFRRMLKDRFRELRKVKDYAQALNMTEKQLNILVREKTGISTSTMIYNQVILEAKRLLNTGISSKEVAYKLHFEDPAHFSKFFKNKTGFSPGRFQKNMNDQ